jgi:hypothetical protein
VEGKARGLENGIHRGDDVVSFGVHRDGIGEAVDVFIRHEAKRRSCGGQRYSRKRWKLALQPIP